MIVYIAIRTVYSIYESTVLIFIYFTFCYKSVKYDSLFSIII